MKRALLLPAGFLIAAALMQLLLRHVPDTFSVDRAQPLLVVTYWYGSGALFAAALLLGCAVAFGGYFLLLRTPRAPALVCGLTCICALLVPAIFSSDVYAYAAYGAMLAHGISPYAHSRLTPGDPLLDAAQWQWGNPLPVCVYGPLFLIVARAAVLFAPFGAAAPLWALRVLACAALVACIPLIVRGFTWLPQNERARSAVVFSLHPAVLWACAEGHNDVLALLAVFAGIALMRKRVFAGGMLAALAAAVKAPALLAACFAWRAARSRRARSVAIAGILAGVAIAVLGSLPLINAALHDVAPHGRFLPHFSPLFVFSLVLPRAWAILAVLVCAVAVAAAGRFRFGALTLALWICVPNPYPWYGVWLVAVAAAVGDGRERRALIAAALLAMLRYTGEAAGLLPPSDEAAIVLIAYAIPVMAFCWDTDRARRHRRESRTAVLDPAPRRQP